MALLVLLNDNKFANNCTDGFNNFVVILARVDMVITSISQWVEGELLELNPAWP